MKVYPFPSRSLATFLLIISCWVGLAESLRATPLLALREAENCGGCHNPGRSQKPFLDRRCSLDCQGCHIDPGGGGARNQWGAYYAKDQSSLVHFLKPIDPLQDQSFIDFHYDGRFMSWSKDGGESHTFPMGQEFTVRLRPLIRYLHLTYTALYLGRIEDNLFRVVSEGDRRFREKYSVMVDNLPLATYLRYARGAPMYGIKRPNHSLWIRQRIGLDQFATTDSFEFGLTPNVPFFRYSIMEGDPYEIEANRQKGTSYHGGVRGVSFGWHLNGSGWETESDYHKIKMKAAGIGANFFKTILYAERNWRKVDTKTEAPADTTLFVHPGSTITEYTIAFAQIRGVTFGFVKEEYEDDTIQSERDNLFVDIHPIPGIQVEFWQRSESGARSLKDVLGILHLYFDW
ncbi:hypothetical protein [Pseudobacteriovorax antillogorgiicola]|uniref:Uncharacterized protein n=1 Tax=Pseudobacteriovorax antillogorgiicola TaxID=1513793 RepID=A0A1Y6BK89_9BACT|nr:hypothetical protein [Pseudobacteriovorax antillogorgiicola]TCS56440.1 hypothetical protein EDD56_104262 [Pseudobacteriovorax antillogorgiicola]SMF05439.1 hypothetical protein SAMN06296036_10471 [Pseudobacteriovorax antillogorgiicola]